MTIFLTLGFYGVNCSSNVIGIGINLSLRLTGVNYLIGFITVRMSLSIKGDKSALLKYTYLFFFDVILILSMDGFGKIYLFSSNIRYLAVVILS